MRVPCHTLSNNGAPLARLPSTSGKASSKSMSHTANFTTHTGQTALSVWHNAVDRPLPILYSYTIYFTNQSLTISSLNAAHMHNTLTANYGDNSVEYRLDLYLLPNASVDDCIAHYRAEKTARGTYREQVRNYESGGTPLGRLPGMVPSYHDKNGDPPHYYHGILYIYDSADWFTSGVKVGEGAVGERFITSVSFDPEGEEEGLAQRIVREEWIAPVDMKVRSKLEGWSMSTRLWHTAPRQWMDEGTWHEAQEKSRTSW